MQARLWFQFACNKPFCLFFEGWLPLQVIIIVWQRVEYYRALFCVGRHDYNEELSSVQWWSRSEYNISLPPTRFIDACRSTFPRLHPDCPLRTHKQPCPYASPSEPAGSLSMHLHASSPLVLPTPFVASTPQALPSKVRLNPARCSTPH